MIPGKCHGFVEIWFTFPGKIFKQLLKKKTCRIICFAKKYLYICFMIITEQIILSVILIAGNIDFSTFVSE